MEQMPQLFLPVTRLLQRLAQLIQLDVGFHSSTMSFLDRVHGLNQKISPRGPTQVL